MREHLTLLCYLALTLLYSEGDNIYLTEMYIVPFFLERNKLHLASANFRKVDNLQSLDNKKNPNTFFYLFIFDVLLILQ